MAGLMIVVATLVAAAEDAAPSAPEVTFAPDASGLLDQAPKIDRLDLISPIELRLVGQLKLLRGVSLGSPSGSIAEDAEKLLRDMAGGED